MPQYWGYRLVMIPKSGDRQTILEVKRSANAPEAAFVDAPRILGSDEAPRVAVPLVVSDPDGGSHLQIYVYYRHPGLDAYRFHKRYEATTVLHPSPVVYVLIDQDCRTESVMDCGLPADLEQIQLLAIVSDGANWSFTESTLTIEILHR